MYRTSYWITEKQHESLKQLTEQSGLKMAEHLRRALDEYLKKMSKNGNFQGDKGGEDGAKTDDKP